MKIEQKILKRKIKKRIKVKKIANIVEEEQR